MSVTTDTGSGSPNQSISRSNEMDSEPRRFKLAFYNDHFVVSYFVGDQPLIRLFCNTGFIA